MNRLLALETNLHSSQHVPFTVAPPSENASSGDSSDMSLKEIIYRYKNEKVKKEETKKKRLKERIITYLQRYK